MSVESLCDVCESARAVEFCDRCGAGVCQQHLDAETGYCADCAREVGSGPQGASQR